LSNFVAVKNLNIQIPKGEFVCIIGDVGSGKSSLLSALIGDLLHLPHSFMDQNEDRVVLKDEEFKKEIY
jgi:ABC-type cobalamin/Fe3+-siderophores transport system ATPase subunit